MFVAADGLADRIQAASYLVFAVAVLIIGIIMVIRAKELRAEVRGVKVTMDTVVVPQVSAVKATADTNSLAIEQINTAVNHKLPHEPTLVRRTANLEQTVAAMDRKFDRFAMKTEKWQNELVAAIGIDVRAANAEQTTKENN